MKKITQAICKAFIEGVDKSLGNDSTHDGSLYLHGNEIAKKTDKGYSLTLAGWGTPTTRERLNGLLSILGYDGRFSRVILNNTLKTKKFL